MKNIMNREIERKLYRAKRIFRTLDEAGLKVGDKFDWTTFITSGKYGVHVGVEPTELAAWANDGFIKFDTKLMVENGNSVYYTKAMTPEEFIEELSKHGKKMRSFHTRNRYEVIHTSFEDYKRELINEILAF